MPKVYAQVHGCPSNTADYEISLGLLKRAGFELVDAPEKADVNVIFTCTVKLTSSQRMIGIIKKLAQTGKPLIVAGCMPKTEQRTIEKIAPDASMVGPDSIGHIVEAAHAALDGEKVIFVKDERKGKTGLPRVRKESKVGILVCSSGCDQACTYCSVRFARGRLKSYPADALVKEAQALVKDGCTELQLTSEDNGSYESNGVRLPQLIEGICRIPGDFKIRVGMMNPTYIRDKKLLTALIEAYKNEKIQKFLHLPLQSGSNTTLKYMKREYTVADFEKIITAFRKEISDIYISTDIIVGYPTERNSDFELTLGLVKKLKFNKINISKFGIRPSTEAAKLKQLHSSVVNKRSKELHDLVKNISLEKAKMT